MLSYHEAGHAVAARMLGVEITHINMVESVDHVANVQTRSAGYVAAANGCAALRAGLYADLQVALAGDIAQLFAGYPPPADDRVVRDVANARGYAAALARIDAGLSAVPRSDEPHTLAPGDPLHTAGCIILECAHADATTLLREEMLPLCSACFSSPNTVVIAIARVFYPDIDTTEGGSVN
jgi:hypothetical protein